MIQKTRFLFLSDWDGTITTRDSNDFLTDENGLGPVRRAELNRAVLDQVLPFRDAFKQMLDHVRLNFEECKAILRHHIVLDPDFILFYQWLKSEDIPLTIVSSGMEPLIRVCLEKLLGEEEAAQIEIVANNVDFVPVTSAEQQCQTRDDGLRWQIQFRHPLSPLGHDKSEAILRHRQLPATSGQTSETSAEEEVKTFIFFSGDGVSDLSAARHANILFAKKDYHLQTYCEREKLPYIPWTTFADILTSTKEIVQKHKEGANQT